MSIRSKEIYVQPRTKKRLFYILQVEQDKANEEFNKQLERVGIGQPNILTTDQIADRLINERIEELYPNIKALEKRLDTLEGQLIGELLNPTVDEKK